MVGQVLTVRQLIFQWEPRTFCTKLPSSPHPKSHSTPPSRPLRGRRRSGDSWSISSGTSSKVVPRPAFPPSVKQTQDQTGYIPHVTNWTVWDSPTSLMIFLSLISLRILKESPSPQSSHTSNKGPIVMSLPSFDGVIVSIPICRVHSLKNGNTGNLTETGSVFFSYFHDFLLCFLNLFLVGSEIHPLLSRPDKPSKHIPSSYLKNCPHDLMSISSLVYSTSQSTTFNLNTNSWHPHPAAHPRLHTLGWLEYHLPYGTVYYVHPTNKVTTVRSERMLTWRWAVLGWSP